MYTHYLLAHHGDEDAEAGNDLGHEPVRWLDVLLLLQHRVVQSEPGLLVLRGTRYVLLDPLLKLRTRVLLPMCTHGGWSEHVRGRVTGTAH